MVWREFLRLVLTSLSKVSSMPPRNGIISHCKEAERAFLTVAIVASLRVACYAS